MPYRSVRQRSASLTVVLLVLAGTSTHGQAPARQGTRHIALEGAPNFRDLGGYQTSDGRHVKWGRVFRSGELSRLTAHDYEILAGLGVTVVCDFRRDDERRNAQTQWQGSAPPEILNLPAAASEAGQETAARSSAAPVASNLSPRLVASYPGYITTLAQSYKTTLRRMIDGNNVVLFHCTAGKDRSGTFAALLLTMLGVPKQTVFEDYLLSNEYVPVPARATGAAASILRVDASYLESVFAAIDRSFGSLDNYRRTALGISDEDLTALKGRLLEN
jgi:protein-tyrosine phosphatase